MKKSLILAAVVSAGLLQSCFLVRDEKDPGYEYAPQMYVSTPYDPYSQVEENTVNPHGMNMRKPVEGTIARSGVGYDNTRLELMHNYPIGKDSIEYAAQVLKNPLEANEKNLKEGKYYYTAYCQPCHGAEGKGDGPVGQKYGGVPNYQASYIADKPSGHIYHVITKGKGRMWGHGSQIRPEDRWKIVMYVNQLRGYTAQ
jgi:mono/diheme cytochrome c family protein